MEDDSFLTKNSKLMKLNLLFLASFFALISQVSGQTATSQEQTNVSQSYDLEDDSQDKEFLIQVNPGTSRLIIRVQAELKSGSLEALIYHPEGRKDGQLSLVADGSEGKSKSSSHSINDKDQETKSKVKVKGRAKGNFEKQFSDPEPGTWTVKVKLTHAEGQLEMMAGQN